MKNRSLIGVMPLWDAEKQSLWMLPGYLQALEEAGAAPLVFPLTQEPEVLARLCALCDGFLFTGGQDVSPALYGQSPRFANVETCPARDAMERQVLRHLLAADKPALGICRGLQFLNAALGGTLWQDLPQERPSKVTHRQRAPYDLPAHEVFLTAGGPLRALMGCDRLAVNSCHHQGVRTLAPALQAMALAPDGLVEAAFAPARRFLWAVQWHPEFAFRRDTHSRKLLRAFVEAMA